MEAVALDGLELLMEPLAKANPTAKVRHEVKGDERIWRFWRIFFCLFYIFGRFYMILDVCNVPVFFGMKKIVI